MKKALLFVLLLATCLVNAQTNDTWLEITLTNQPSSLIYITLGKNRYSSMGSQAFTAKIKNVTTGKLRVKGTLIANLTCGNQVTNDFNFTVEPGETVGGGSALMGDDVGLLAVATKDDCPGEQFTPDVSRPNYHVYNRIKSLSIVNLTIQEVKPVKYNNVEVGEEEPSNVDDSKEKNATTKSNSSTSSSNSSQAKSSGTSYNSNQAANAQKQEQALEQKREEQLSDLSRKSRAQANAASNFLNGLGSIYSNYMMSEARKELASQNRSRDSKFNELERQLKTENGHLEDCGNCSGEGYTNCGSCGSKGYKTCSSCYGKGGQRCPVCNGTGKGMYNMACITCFGKGTKDCNICGNSGKELCGTCNGIGKRFCNQCEGAGKKFKRDYSGGNETGNANSYQNDIGGNSNQKSKTTEVEKPLSATDIICIKIGDYVKVMGNNMTNGSITSSSSRRYYYVGDQKVINVCNKEFKKNYYDCKCNYVIGNILMNEEIGSQKDFAADFHRKNHFYYSPATAFSYYLRAIKAEQPSSDAVNDVIGTYKGDPQNYKEMKVIIYKEMASIVEEAYSSMTSKFYAERYPYMAEKGKKIYEEVENTHFPQRKFLDIFSELSTKAIQSSVDANNKAYQLDCIRFYCDKLHSYSNHNRNEKDVYNRDEQEMELILAIVKHYSNEVTNGSFPYKIYPEHLQYITSANKQTRSFNPSSPQPKTTSNNNSTNSAIESIHAILNKGEPKTVPSSKSSQSYIDDGNSYFSDGKYQDAINSFTKAIEADSKNALAYYYRGLTYKQLGQFGRACTDFEYCIDLNYKAAEDELSKTCGTKR